MTSTTTKEHPSASVKRLGAKHHHHKRHQMIKKLAATNEGKFVSDLVRASVDVRLTSDCFELRRGAGVIVKRKLELSDLDMHRLGLIGAPHAKRGPPVTR